MKTGTLGPVSNAATWNDTIEVFDAEDGEAFDLTDVEAITLKLRDPSGATVLEGELDDEIIVVGDAADGTIEFTFSASAMSALDPKTYEVGLLITDEDDFVTQLILGHLPVVEGL